MYSVHACACVLTLLPSWQELPKSTIFIALRLGLHKRMFSGFRSQCMMFSSGVARNSSAVQSCWANFLVRLRETPRKLVLRNRSYRLYDSSSNTRHRWLRNMKCLFRVTATNKKQWVKVWTRWGGGGRERQSAWRWQSAWAVTYIILVVLVIVVHKLQQLDFYVSLIYEGLLVLYNLNGDLLLLECVKGLYHLIKVQITSHPLDRGERVCAIIYVS